MPTTTIDGGEESKEKKKENHKKNLVVVVGCRDGMMYPKRKKRQDTGIVVKTEGEEDASSMAPFECFGSDKKADGREGTMA